MASIASVKESMTQTGTQVMRPLRYAGNVIKGTVTGLLDGMANTGRKGFWAGVGLGIFAGIATGAVAGTVLMFAAGGLVLGAGAGAVYGAVTGGYRNVALEARRDKYSHELAERQAARADREARAHPVHDDHRESFSRRKNTANYNFERQLQQERENDRDYGTYWQDRMDAQRSNSTGRGF